MRRHKHLFDQVASLENLFAAARDALRGKRLRQPGAAFFADLEKEVFSLHEELGDGSYQPGSYHYFTIHEPKQRVVAAAPFRDRVVHHAIVRVIQPLFESRFIEDSFACLPGKGTHAAMRRASRFAQRFDYALKCDVQKYFPSIDHAILLRLLGRVIGDRRLMELMAAIIASHEDGRRQEWPPGGDLLDVQIHRHGLPIGNLTSQFFANVYLNALDHFVKHDLRVNGYCGVIQARTVAQAENTGSLVQGKGWEWNVIGSTATVDARDNAVVSAPVYLLDGSTKIADGFADMWDGSIDNPGRLRDSG